MSVPKKPRATKGGEKSQGQTVLGAGLIAACLLKKMDGLHKFVEPGEWPIHGVARIRFDCVVSKTAPTKAKQSYRPDLAMMLACVCAQLGVKPEQVREAVEKAVKAVYLGDVPQQHLDIADSALKDAAGEIVENLPLLDKSGSTSVKGEVEVLEFLPV